MESKRLSILVIDGQGGGIGRQAVARIKELAPWAEVTAVGTNALATSAMLKAGADQGATGENAVRVCAAEADLILAPIGMVLCDAMLGEVTAVMAAAVGGARAQKILVPVSRCSVTVAGMPELSLTERAAAAAEAAAAWIRAHSEA